MATNITERFNEMSALAALTAATGALSDLVKEQSGKRYARSVTARRERWLQIASLAEAQAQKTNDPAPRRTVRKRAVPIVAANGTPIAESEQATMES